MKLKNLFKVAIVAPIILLFSFSVTGKVNATQVSPVSFNLYNSNNSRPTGYYSVNAYSNTTPVIKITSGSYKENANTAIYCLRNGLGFGNLNQNSTAINYNQNFNLKDDKFVNATDSSTSTYRNVLPKTEKIYNEMLWVLNKVSMVEDDTSRNNLIKEAGLNPADAFRNYNLNGVSQNASAAEDDIVKDVIDVIQQTAIWTFSNEETKTTDPGHTPKGDGIFYVGSDSQSVKSSLLSVNNKMGSDTAPGSLQDEESYILYKYLVNSAIDAVENKNWTYKDVSSPIEFDETRDVIVEENDKYFIGPYRLNQINTTPYNLNVSIKDGTTDLTGVTLVGADKKTVLTGSSYTKMLQNNLNKDFYIELPTTTTASNVVISVNAVYSTRNLTYWAVGGGTNSTQPLVVIEDKKVPYEKSAQQTIIRKNENFDLALRKFITSVETSKGIKRDYDYSSRVPRISQDALKALAQGKTELDASTGSTVTKTHIKDPLKVETGDLVTYTIRIYNEGSVDGKATSITDYLPNGLELAENSDINTKYGWKKDSKNSNKVVSTWTASQADLKAFDPMPASGAYTISYIDVPIQCRVTATTKNTDTMLKNIAEITTASNDNDIDSKPGNVNSNPSTYNPTNPTTGRGEQDDDDYEELVLKGKYFDLALRKYITGVTDTKENTTEISNRVPNVDITPLVNGTDTTAIYRHIKNPVSVKAGDIVTYTIRVYNEGEVDGYADKIVDHLPEELEFPVLTSDNVSDEVKKAVEFNSEKGWIIDPSDKTNRTIYSKTLSKENDEDNIIKAFDGKELKYKETQIKCIVKNTAQPRKEITNIAEIAESSNSYNLPDRDNKKSTTIPADADFPAYKGDSSNKDDLSDKDYYYKGQEDDDDFDKVILESFDLALRKFITGVNDTKIDSRIPQIDTSKFGTIVDGKQVTTCTYNHTKEPVRVCQNDIVTYTIRVYNEGTQNGYAEEIKDDIPAGLEFVPDNEINQTYTWKMLDENGQETTDVTKAKSIVTDYRSKEKSTTNNDNLIKAFDKETMAQKGPNYVDVKVAFKVTTPNTSDRIIINSAQVSKDLDEDGNEVEDIDSTPDNMENGNPKEDDEDIEKIYVKYFDLALRKWVTTAIVIEDGTQKEMATGHYAEQEPEPVVKVEVNKKRMKNTVIKFKYSIRVTNEGEIPGYATELSDYIPKGLKFNQADNPDWKESGDKIITTKLKDTLLNPGDQAFVDLTLTWINSEDNMGVMTNWAEISKDKNDSNTPDIDSTPNNKVEGEDDFDYAPVAITVVAGSAPRYIALSSSILAIIGTGAVLIKRFVI